MWQEAAREERPGGARSEEEGEGEEGEGEGEEGEGEGEGEYDVRDDELDPPRDYDDYTDNAHHEPHRD